MGSSTPAATAAGGQIADVAEYAATRVARRETRPSHRPVAVWLLICAATVFCITVVGGVTRLTRSGLSITEWQPVSGVVPPLTAREWDEAFAKYRQTPEYKLVNHQMTLQEFKRIFWWEYAHRLLARAVGLVYLLPFVFFLARRRIPPGYVRPLLLIFVLGGLQGLLGWLMVKSGLVSDPRVSPFRLTAHLALALVIFGAMLWTAFSLFCPIRAASHPAGRRARVLADVVVGLVMVMAVTGGLVAGFRAGYSYNTWPLMNGYLVPPFLLQLEPAWRNLFWNIATVQFNHRVAAYLLAAAAAALWIAVRRLPEGSRRGRLGAHALAAMVFIQASLGVATLVWSVPIGLAVLHQAGAMITLALALNVAHALR